MDDSGISLVIPAKAEALYNSKAGQSSVLDFNKLQQLDDQLTLLNSYSRLRWNDDQQ